MVPLRLTLLGVSTRGSPREPLWAISAQGREGGRVFTVRTHRNDGVTPFADGQYCEAGAHRIPETHDRTLGYVNELGLGSRLVEYSKAIGAGTTGDTLFVLKDRRFLFDGVWPSHRDFTAEERTTAFFPQDVKYDYRWVTGPRPPKGTNFLGNPTVPEPGVGRPSRGSGFPT
jgi:Flavin containing amine oxidoreductase